VASIESLGFLSGDASEQVLHKGHGQVQAESLCGVLGWQLGVVGGAERVALVLPPGLVRSLEGASGRAVRGVGEGLKGSGKAGE
jgi:hypothetical protein